MSQQMDELRQRVEARRRKLENDLAALKGRAAGQANAQIAQIEASLGRIQNDLRAGWDNVSEEVARKLSLWLRDRDG